MLAKMKDALAHLTVEGAGANKPKASMTVYVKQYEKASQTVKKGQFAEYITISIGIRTTWNAKSSIAEGNDPTQSVGTKVYARFAECEYNTTTTKTIAKTYLHKEKEVKVQQQKRKRKVKLARNNLILWKFPRM